MWLAYAETRFGSIPVSNPPMLRRLGDVKGLAAWAARYHVHVTIVWARKSEPKEA